MVSLRFRGKTPTFILICSMLAAGCSSSASNRYFGKTVAPKDNVLRYVSGSEPESLDPQVPDGQPEARIYLALYEGLVDYDPKTLLPIPALATSWEIAPGVDEYLFHIRNTGKFSDGKPITAKDFVYSMRRGFAPETLSRTANLGYPVMYSEAFNGGRVFVKKGDAFLLKKDFGGAETKPPASIGPETEFHKFIRSPERLTLDGDEKKRAKQLAADPKLQAASEGAEFVPVKAEDIGVEAIDDYTLRISLRQSAPYFLGLLAHQFFRVVPQQTIEKFGKAWTRKENIVTNGPFRIKEIRPYDALIVERDPNYWDAANVHLDGIQFYPMEEQSTAMNLYKAGSIDAFLNHFVPSSWIDDMRGFKDEYLNFPEASTAYYSMNTTKPPFDNVKVRRAFVQAVDQVALSNFRKVTKPLTVIAPTGIFPDYDKAREKVKAELGGKVLSFDAEQARKTLTEAGYPVQKNGSTYSCPTFPTDTISLSYNTGESNRQIAEFIQAQWRANLGITVQLKNMEFKTFLPLRHELQYVGFAQTLWSGDYVDPNTFLGLFYGKDNNGDTGLIDPKFDKMMDDANSELDPQKRYEMLARAEYYILDQAVVVPLTINATNWMKKPYVKGMYPNAGTLMPWKFVYIEQDPAKWDTNVDDIMAGHDPQVEKQLADIVSTQKSPTGSN